MTTATPDTIVMALALADFARRVAAEVSRVERGVIDRDTFYERVADAVVNLNRVTKDSLP